MTMENILSGHPLGTTCIRIAVIKGNKPIERLIEEISDKDGNLLHKKKPVRFVKVITSRLRYKSHNGKKYLVSGYS